ncbi:hypothetical protein RhiirC2_730692 [Rhizophagus irregularis]|uniref:Uncharacterized protein n=1 Tax=Rhizophagus irregularis TaxID=588596 RepID=A0A2N1NVW8_9GLOM|nr:hypothetical protein RhiirC2_730692 [Rhizophagus irregularis]
MQSSGRNSGAESKNRAILISRTPESANLMARVSKLEQEKVNDEIRQRKQEKKLRDQLSSREVSSTPLSDNNMSKISVGPPCQNSHRKKGAEISYN